MARTLVAIPVYNEAKYVRRVLDRVLSFAQHVLVIDDGSTDDTPHYLADAPVDMIRHVRNRGYGRAMRDSFRWAIHEGYDWLITMDCDEQHEPESIPHFIKAAARLEVDVISGSRYMDHDSHGHDVSAAPADRRAINRTITREINDRFAGLLGATITDAFCGFKAYRVEALRSLRPSVSGYAFPMQFWVQAAARGLRVAELPVSLIYNDPNRTFGEVLDNPEIRLAHYRQVMHREICRQADHLPREALAGLDICGTRAMRRQGESVMVDEKA